MKLDLKESVDFNIEVVNREIDSMIPLLIRRKELFALKQDGKSKEQASQYILHMQRLAAEADLVNLLPDSIMVHLVLEGLTDKVLKTKILEHWEGLTMLKLESIVKAQETVQACTYGGKLGLSANASDVADKGDYKCYKCGKRGHIRPRCDAKNLNCTKCNAKTHATSVCHFNKPVKEPAKREEETEDEANKVGGKGGKPKNLKKTKKKVKPKKSVGANKAQESDDDYNTEEEDIESNLVRLNIVETPPFSC